MKNTIYIPRGETVQYDQLYAERIIVDGCLRVEKGLDAKVIGGKGTIHAGKVSANTIRIGYLDACFVMCKRIFARHVDTPELFASEFAVVSGILSACMVKSPKLTVGLYEVEELKVEELVTVPTKRRSVFGILFITTLQAILAAIWAKMNTGKNMSTAREPVKPANQKPSKPMSRPHQGAESKPTATPLVDEELNRVISLFKLSRESGYTLQLIPGAPEDNAPVSNAEQGRIIRPAA